MSRDGVWARPLAEVLERRPKWRDKQLATQSQVNQKTIAYARMGGRISLDSADRLCLALGYSLAQLYGEGDGTPTQEDRERWAAHLEAEQERHNGRAA